MNEINQDKSLSNDVEAIVEPKIMINTMIVQASIR
jgi:hypothetical protein